MTSSCLVDFTRITSSFCTATFVGNLLFHSIARVSMLNGEERFSCVLPSVMTTRTAITTRTTMTTTGITTTARTTMPAGIATAA